MESLVPLCGKRQPQFELVLRRHIAQHLAVLLDCASCEEAAGGLRIWRRNIHEPGTRDARRRVGQPLEVRAQ